MAQFLRPISDVTNPAELTGGFADIDESSASDTDYIYGTNNTNVECEFALTDTGITDPAVGTGHIVRWRHAQADSDAGTPAPSSGGTATVHSVELRQGITVIATAANAVTTNESSFAAGSYTLSEAEANSITDYTDLRIYFLMDGSGGSPANRRSVAISWAELEIPDASGTTLQLTATAACSSAVTGQATFSTKTKQLSTETGSELVTNGSFDSGGTGWSASGESTINTGVGRVLSTAGAYSEIFQSSVQTIDSRYKLEFDVTSTDGTNLQNSSSVLTYPTSTVGSKIYFFTAPTTSLSFKRPGGVCDVSIDNVSVKEVLFITGSSSVTGALTFAATAPLALTATADGVSLVGGAVGFKTSTKQITSTTDGVSAVTGQATFAASTKALTATSATNSDVTGQLTFDTQTKQLTSTSDGVSVVTGALGFAANTLQLTATTDGSSAVTGDTTFSAQTKQLTVTSDGVSLVTGDVTILAGALQLTATSDGSSAVTADIGFATQTKQVTITTDGSSAVTGGIVFATSTSQLIATANGLSVVTAGVTFVTQTKQLTTTSTGVSLVTGQLGSNAVIIRIVQKAIIGGLGGSR